MESKLLPCPFCGGEPASRLGYKDINWIECRCGKASVKYYRKSSDCIEAWNTRHPDYSALLSEENVQRMLDATCIFDDGEWHEEMCTEDMNQ